MDILEKTFFSIWIDFGHTNIRIGIFQDHKFEIMIYDIQRIIGRKYSDQDFQIEMRKWPFKILSDEHDSPIIEVQYKGQTSHFTPSEIATIFFQQIKKISDLYFLIIINLYTEK